MAEITPAFGSIEVHGLANLNRALRKADKDVRLGIRRELRLVAEPVREAASKNATASISNLGVPWSRMRVGISTDLVYVAPVKHGVSRTGNAGLRRPNLSRLMIVPMQQALDDNAGMIKDRFYDMLDGVADKFNR